MPLALYTFGVFSKPADDPANDGFHRRNDPIFELVDQAEGLIARSGYASDPGPLSWGEEVYPRFYEERGDGWSPATLSLWTDMEALFSFTYFGLHAEALRRGRDWFEKPQWPPLAMWWHHEETYPVWAEAVRRHAHLHEHGPTPVAFTFKQPFDEKGMPVKLDKARIQALRP
ncbi:DUF3291 domain-containing protein [Nitratireductor aquimarinus]|uniref:DUF3291 domain-containing protein n=1 Tax=Nitratireductor TaxID=245876 RepID=UPI0019D34734|nr:MULTISPECIES: DUF3291 domain-containing protein [Nitratireductor]MBN7776752.1 DUF3291 domain-containing protein [Nitratireductor pacificus]MBN7780086.1 DUF3291 domain-containing protein [Nitratireductor pacificus]MBN7788893.1 DUF3291 domain-containing protein [Nitratireductor aquimarinus]MBY6098961.1 DUF3291 domain-containing protein [Nitratireductor aquimarinus]MCA1259379.1 DUF3291 domain-containing protein [Nitratireductor aquimarinus]